MQPSISQSIRERKAMDPRPSIRPAATVIVTAPIHGDEAQPGYSVFTVKRSHGSGFMAGAHVFPGGVVDDVDREAFGEEFQARYPDCAYRIAAVRELFEETGILLITPSSALEALSPDALQESRNAVHQDASAFETLCNTLNCRPAIERMLPWSRWITPPQEKRRFDARFYIAILANTPDARHDDEETISSCWLSPDDALESAEGGEIFLPPPTWFTFRELRALPNQGALQNALAKGRDMRAIEPHILPGEGELILVMQGDIEHPEAPGNERNRIVLKDGQYTLHIPEQDKEER